MFPTLLDLGLILNKAMFYKRPFVVAKSRGELLSYEIIEQEEPIEVANSPGSFTRMKKAPNVLLGHLKLVKEFLLMLERAGGVSIVHPGGGVVEYLLHDRLVFRAEPPDSPSATLFYVEGHVLISGSPKDYFSPIKGLTPEETHGKIYRNQKYDLVIQSCFELAGRENWGRVFYRFIKNK